MKKINPVYFYSAIVAFGGFVFGLDAAIISGTVNFISVEFGLNDLEIGAVVSAPGFGVIFALLVTGYIVDTFGRKGTLILIASFYLLSAICSALAPTFTLLVAARFLGGLAFTSLSVSAMYIGEIAPPELRGKMVAMNQINTVVGLSAAYFVNYLIINSGAADFIVFEELGLRVAKWRWMLGSEIIPASLWLVLLFFIPQSPRWLLMKNRNEEAKKVLMRYVPLEKLQHVIEDLGGNNLANPERSFLSRFKEIFQPRLRKILWLGLAVSIIQPITGINAILFYAPTVFEQAGVGTDTAFVQAVYIGIVSLVFTFLAFILIDRIGRRPLTIIGLTWAALSLGLCTYGFYQAKYSFSTENVALLQNQYPQLDFQDFIGKSYASDVEFKEAMQTEFGNDTFRKIQSNLLAASVELPAMLILFGILGFIAAFQLSIGPVLWVILSEIFPTALRGVAIPSFAFVVSLVSYFVQQFFPWQLSHMGATYIFLFYAVVTGLGAIILWRILPETKNKSIEEITLELQ